MLTSLFDDAPWALERFLGSGGTGPDVAGRELDRFFELAAQGKRPLAMISRNVDLLWHTLIEHTELYAAFCRKRYGRFIHHRPRSATCPIPASAVRNFYNDYAAQYGPVGAEWEADAPSELVAFGRRRTDEEPRNARWSGWPGPDPLPSA
jgi:hypothetical protein